MAPSSGGGSGSALQRLEASWSKVSALLADQVGKSPDELLAPIEALSGFGVDLEQQ